MDYLEYSEDSNASGSKFVLSCKDITDDTKTTQEWLNDVSGLKIISPSKAIGMGHKKILEGILNKRAKVVVKIADVSEDLAVEWNIFQVLKEHKIPGILHYYCYFKCSDTISKYVRPQDHLCEGTGDAMQVLVMEYINNKSFKNFNWSRVDVKVFRSCLKQSILTMLEAFHKCKFVHGDFHLDNVLIQPTKKKEIRYDCYPEPIELLGFQIKLMDFELSKSGQLGDRVTANDLLKDVKTFINKVFNLAAYFDLLAVQTIFGKLLRWTGDRDVDANVLLELIPLCDEIRRTDYVSQSGGIPVSGKRRRLHLGKK